MIKKFAHIFILHIAGTVWFVNGYFCKILNLVPRHQQIVATVFNDENLAFYITKGIGLFEILMSVWILSGYKKRVNVYTQIIVIAVMNTIEYFIAQDLLLWGKWNALFAFGFIVLLYFNDTFLSNHPLKIHYSKKVAT